MSHGQPWTAMDLAKIHKIQHKKIAHPSGTNLQLAPETCEFAQAPSDSTDGKVTNRALLSTESEKVHLLYLPHDQLQDVIH